MKVSILSFAVVVLLGAILVEAITPPGRIPEDMNRKTTNRLFVDEFKGFDVATLEFGDFSVDLMVAGNQVVEGGVSAFSDDGHSVNSPRGIRLDGSQVELTADNNLKITSTGGVIGLFGETVTMASQDDTSFTGVDFTLVSREDDIVVDTSDFTASAETLSVRSIDNTRFDVDNDATLNADLGILVNAKNTALTSTDGRIDFESTEFNLNVEAYRFDVNSGDLFMVAEADLEIGAAHNDFTVSSHQDTNLIAGNVRLEGIQGVGLAASDDLIVTAEKAVGFQSDIFSVSSENTFVTADYLFSQIKVATSGSVQASASDVSVTGVDNVNFVAEDRVSFTGQDVSSGLTATGNDVLIGDDSETLNTFIKAKSALLGDSQGTTTVSSKDVVVKSIYSDINLRGETSQTFTGTNNLGLSGFDSTFTGPVVTLNGAVADFTSEGNIAFSGAALTWTATNNVLANVENSLSFTAPTLTLNAKNLLNIGGDGYISATAGTGLTVTSGANGQTYEGINSVVFSGTSINQASTGAYTITGSGDVFMSAQTLLSLTASTSDISFSTTRVNDEDEIDIVSASTLTFSSGNGKIVKTIGVSYDWESNSNTILGTDFTLTTSTFAEYDAHSIVLKSEINDITFDTSGVMVFDVKVGSGSVQSGAAQSINTDGNLLGDGKLDITTAGGSNTINIVSPITEFRANSGRDDIVSFSGADAILSGKSFNTVGAGISFQTNSFLGKSTDTLTIKNNLESNFQNDDAIFDMGATGIFSITATSEAFSATFFDIDADSDFTVTNTNAFTISTSTSPGVFHSPTDIRAQTMTVNSAVSTWSSADSLAITADGKSTWNYNSVGFHATRDDVNFHSDHDLIFSTTSNANPAFRVSSPNIQFDSTVDTTQFTTPQTIANAFTNSFTSLSKNLKMVATRNFQTTTPILSATALGKMVVTGGTTSVTSGNTAVTGGDMTLRAVSGKFTFTSARDVNILSSTPVPGNSNDYDIKFSSTLQTTITSDWWHAVADGNDETRDIGISISSSANSILVNNVDGDTDIQGNNGLLGLAEGKVTLTSAKRTTVTSQNGAVKAVSYGTNNALSESISIAATIPGVNPNAGSVVFKADLAQIHAIAGKTYTATATGNIFVNSFDDITIRAPRGPLNLISNARDVSYTAAYFLEDNKADLAYNVAKSMAVTGSTIEVHTRPNTGSPGDISILATSDTTNLGSKITAPAGALEIYTGGDSKFAIAGNGDYTVNADNIGFSIGGQASIDVLSAAATNLLFKGQSVDIHAGGNSGSVQILAQQTGVIGAGGVFNISAADSVTEDGASLTANVNQAINIASDAETTGTYATANGAMTLTSKASGVPVGITVTGYHIDFSANTAVSIDPDQFIIGDKSTFYNPRVVFNAKSWVLNSAGPIQFNALDDRIFIESKSYINTAKSSSTVSSNGNVFIESTGTDIPGQGIVNIVASNARIGIQAKNTVEMYGNTITLGAGTTTDLDIASTGTDASNGLFLASKNHLLFSAAQTLDMNVQQTATYAVASAAITGTTASFLANDPKGTGFITVDSDNKITVKATGGDINLTTDGNNARIVISTQEEDSDLKFTTTGATSSITSTSGASTSIVAGNVVESAASNLNFITTSANSGSFTLRATDEISFVASTSFNVQSTTTDVFFNSYDELKVAIGKTATFTATSDIVLETENGGRGDIIIDYNAASTTLSGGLTLSADNQINFRGKDVAFTADGSWDLDVVGFQDIHSNTNIQISAAAGIASLIANDASIAMSSGYLASVTAQTTFSMLANDGISFTGVQVEDNTVEELVRSQDLTFEATTSDVDFTLDDAELNINGYNYVQLQAQNYMEMIAKGSETQNGFTFGVKMDTTDPGADIMVVSTAAAIATAPAVVMNVNGVGEDAGVIQILDSDVRCALGAQGCSPSGIVVAAHSLSMAADGDFVVESRGNVISGERIIVVANGGVQIERISGDATYDPLLLQTVNDASIIFQTRDSGDNMLHVKSDYGNIDMQSRFRTTVLNAAEGLYYSATGSVVMVSERVDPFPGIIFTAQNPISLEALDDDIVFHGRHVRYGVLSFGTMQFITTSKLGGDIKFNLIVPSGSIATSNALMAGDATISTVTGPIHINSHCARSCLVPGTPFTDFPFVSSSGGTYTLSGRTLLYVKTGVIRFVLGNTAAGRINMDGILPPTYDAASRGRVFLNPRNHIDNRSGASVIFGYNNGNLASGVANFPIILPTINADEGTYDGTCLHNRELFIAHPDPNRIRAPNQTVPPTGNANVPFLLCVCEDHLLYCSTAA